MSAAVDRRAGIGMNNEWIFLGGGREISGRDWDD
jgi:hypothetical protein